MLSKPEIAARLSEKGVGALGGLTSEELMTAIELCGEAGDAAMLAEIAAGPCKAAAKSARRMLHGLRTRGMAVPEARPAGKSLLHPVEDEFGTVCLVSAFDPGGGRAAFLLRRNPAGGVLAVVLYLDEVKGIEGASSSVISRKEARAYVADLTRGGGEISVVRVDEGLFREILHEARETTGRAGRTLPEETAKIPGEWFEAPPAKAIEGSAAGLPDAAESQTLYSEPEIARWMPDRDLMSSMELRVREIETSRILVDEEAKMGHVEMYFSEATAEYFTMDARRRYASRLAWTATIFDLTGRPGAASMARSASAWLQAPSLPADGCGFTREFLRRMFVLEPPIGSEDEPPDEGRPADGEPSRLIVTPGDLSGASGRGRGGG